MRPICIFDLDDTLLESSARFEKAILGILDEEGIEYDAAAVTKIILPIGPERTAEYFQKCLGVSGSTEEIKSRIHEKQLFLYRDVFELKPGVRAYLDRLTRERNRLFVLTASPKSLAIPALCHNGILDLFEEVWSAEEDFGFNKNDTCLFHEVVRKLETPPSLIRYFDDSLKAIETANQVGLETFLVYNGQMDLNRCRWHLRRQMIVESFEDLV